MQTKSFAYLLAAGILLLPVCGIAAEKSESHTVTTAEETSADEAKNDAPASEDKKLAEEMDELGGEVEEPQDTRVKQNGKESGQDSTEEKSTVSSDDTVLFSSVLSWPQTGRRIRKMRMRSMPPWTR